MWSAPLLRGKHRSGIQGKFSPSVQRSATRFELPDYDILITILSILKWQQLNGTIKLYGDSVSVSQYAALGMLELWDEYDTVILDGIDCETINPTLFWSAGKFFAILNEAAPCVSMDTDMVVWQPLDDLCAGFDLRFTHWEAVEQSSWYGRRKDLSRPPGYRFKRAWNWGRTMAANTSLVYFGDQQLKDYYATEALRYMQHNSTGVTFLQAETPEILFAEQRLLPLCAEEKNAAFQPFLDATWSARRSYFTKHDERHGEWLFFSIREQPLFTHVWFYKRYIEGNESVRQEYCRELVRAILDEFPSKRELLERIACVRSHL
jgi:hypothetical protein